LLGDATPSAELAAGPPWLIEGELSLFADRNNAKAIGALAKNRGLRAYMASHLSPTRRATPSPSKPISMMSEENHRAFQAKRVQGDFEALAERNQAPAARAPGFAPERMVVAA
jgi:hypothetical protein